MSKPDLAERCPYGIGDEHWPGVAKVEEEMGELATVLGKLKGSGGRTDHWSGDLGQMMADEVADLRAALDFLIAFNPVLEVQESYMRKRHLWKRALFMAWHLGKPKGQWPRPEDFGLPKIEGR